MRKGCVIAIQDMGAAGLTCSAVEMGAKGDLGITLDLNAVPTREEGMSAYEMMLSESQERMLMVLKPEKEKEAEAIFRKWGLDFAIVGETTDTKRFIVCHGGDVMADLPIKELGDEAPEYQRPYTEQKKQPVLDPGSIPCPLPIFAALEKLVGSPDLCSKRWVWQQYDHLILGNTVQRPGGDAAVIRVGEGPKALAMTTDVTPRYCEADPFEGGKQAVAEAWRNLTAVGARPSPSPTISISATPSGRRSWASLSIACAASPRPAASSTSRSCPATSRSTTKRTGGRFCQRRQSAASACSKICRNR